MLFGWSISKNFTTNNISNQIEIKSEDPKIKLFENEKSRTLRVAVLNGCGERGIGDQFSSFLNNSYGLIITRTENAKDEDGENKFDYENTKVIIINENNAEEVWNKLKEDPKQDVVLFALDQEGYETISTNFADIRIAIAEHRNIIIAYKDYYEPNPHLEDEEDK